MDIAVPATPEVSIIIPARNEEVCLGDCLQSLVSQTGLAFEIIVVDDQSTDRTRAIAESFTGVRVISPGPLPDGWTGKNNAVVAGVRETRGEWLLFTDADTVHLPGSLSRAIAEAKENQAELLSYSPEQIAVTFWEIATLPVVFAELARQYPPAKVSDPVSRVAAANGQYILVRREAYDAVGGHAAIATSLLEDVALARAVKESGRRIRFRYAPDSVRTRMYRNFRQLREGWTKNLALLFPRPGRLATKVLLEWIVAWGLFWGPWIVRLGAELTRGEGALSGLHRSLGWLVNLGWPWWWNSSAVLALSFLMMRLRRANFTWDMEVLGALFGYPMFSYLLWRSKRAHERRDVWWKGRTYSGGTLAPAAVAQEISRPSGTTAKVVLDPRH
jgi:glycosyltransferase involved in cell wall biosynthesis